MSEEKVVLPEELTAEQTERQKFVAELLDTQAVKDAYQKGQETFDAIDAVGTKSEKVAAFLDSPLQRERKKVEAYVFTEEEHALVESATSKVLDSPETQTLLFGTEDWHGVLLDAIEAMLLSKEVNPDVIRNELLHYRAVYELAQNFYPDNMLLQIAALVHDSHKYDASGKMQLTLHELASTLTGGQLVDAALKKAVESGVIDLKPEEIAATTKAITRAILTHGKGEFPQKKSQPNPVEGENTEDLYWLWGQLYPVPKVDAHPSDPKQPRDTLQDVVSGLNISDIFTGNDPSSLKKYNLVYSNDVLGSLSTSEYLRTCIFDSYGDNFFNAALDYHLNNSEPEEMEKVIAVMRADNEQSFLLTLLLVGEQDPRYDDKKNELSEYLAFIAENPLLQQLADLVTSTHVKIEAEWRLKQPLKEQFNQLPKENVVEREALLEQLQPIEARMTQLRNDFNLNFEGLVSAIMHFYKPGLFSSTIASKLQANSSA